MAVEKSMEVEETLRKIVAKILRKDDVVLTPTTTFKELGADSLDVVQILVALEEAYDIELVDEELKSINNLGGFIDYVKQKVAEKK
ncbi:MAG: acyl carrier protein [Dehalococcoidales bacterium]|jgi:acyl carrier protein|nr:acyl carrier protein [Dehalococcoidales bacterium]